MGKKEKSQFPLRICIHKTMNLKNNFDIFEYIINFYVFKQEKEYSMI